MLWYIETRPMQIEKFDKMAGDDQGEYISEFIMRVQQILKEEGKADLAARVHTLFRAKQNPTDKRSLGMADFVANLARGRDPNARLLEVEDALAETLKKNKIVLPQGFYILMNDFKSRHSAK